MKPIIDWLISGFAGILLSTQLIRILKVANEEDESRMAAGIESSAIPRDMEQPYIMGSEQISAALQQILSSDANGLKSPKHFMGNMPNSIRSDFSLGSESLDRMLEDMSANPSNGTAKLPCIEPAIQI